MDSITYHTLRKQFLKTAYSVCRRRNIKAPYQTIEDMVSEAFLSISELQPKQKSPPTLAYKAMDDWISNTWLSNYSFNSHAIKNHRQRSEIAKLNFLDTLSNIEQKPNQKWISIRLYTPICSDIDVVKELQNKVTTFKKRLFDLNLLKKMNGAITFFDIKSLSEDSYSHITTVIGLISDLKKKDYYTFAKTINQKWNNSMGLKENTPSVKVDIFAADVSRKQLTRTLLNSILFTQTDDLTKFSTDKEKILLKHTTNMRAYSLSGTFFQLKDLIQRPPTPLFTEFVSLDSLLKSPEQHSI